MIKQITHISTHQSAKVVSALYVLFTLPFVLVGIVGLIFSPAGSNFPFWFFSSPHYFMAGWATSFHDLFFGFTTTLPKE